jgi:hypothetical protein
MLAGFCYPRMDNSDSAATVRVRDHKKAIDVRSAHAEKPLFALRMIRVGTIQRQGIRKDRCRLAEGYAVFS